MAVSTNVMDAIAGALQGFNQQADRNEDRQLKALQLLAQSPGASIGPATTPQPAGFLRQLTGTPYEAGPGGAPVVNLGGQALTVTKAPTFADAMPGLFATPPPGL